MRKTLAVLIAVLLIEAPAFAHRLDEYLQATTLAVEKDRIEVQIRLTPGVEVIPAVLPAMDSNADGLISEAEQRTYAMKVADDLSLTVDGHALPLRLVASKFAKPEEMREGLGDIALDFVAEAPPGGSSNRKLTFQNHHQNRIGAYLANTLIPRDPDIRITGQSRNYQQSFYQVDYEQAGAAATRLSQAVSLGALVLFAGLGLLLRTSLFGAQ